MTKAELIDKIADDADISKKAAGDALDSAFGWISKTLKKEKRFSVPGFGTFKVTKRKARKGRNPQTGEVIKIKASKSVNFKPAPKLKVTL
jgi:DNA-binding protein HU-beta